MTQENIIKKGAIDCRPRVLVVDNSKDTRRHILELLEEESYCAKAANGEGQTLSEAALAFAKSLRPHVAIIDLRIAGAPSLDKSRTRGSRCL